MSKPFALECKKLNSPTKLTILYVGSDLEKGALPALFYFALSAKESLTLDPFNQPVQFLKDSPLRCFSFTLPGHEEGKKATDAMKHWADLFQAGKDPLADFLSDALTNIHFLIQEGWIDTTQMAFAGLSRGGFIAALLSTFIKEARWVLAFAPLTCLSTLIEFQDPLLADIAEKYALQHFAPQFSEKALRFYIGNRDERVSTDSCYQFIRQAADAAYSLGKRTSLIELIIRPSIGYLGHGTSPETFKEGIEWLKKEWFS